MVICLACRGIEGGDELKSLMSRKVEDAAFLFMAKLVTLKVLDVLAERYPGSVRATVHPKIGQFGIYLVNSKTRVFPWQGVPLRGSDGRFRIVSTAEAWDHARCVVRNDADGSFLYYAENVSRVGNIWIDGV